MSLENGWTAIGADVGVNPADLALPPPLLYHAEAAAEALARAEVETEAAVEAKAAVATAVAEADWAVAPI